MNSVFGSLVQKLQNIGSPVGSPVASPKGGRRRYAKTPNQRRQSKQEYREVQSEPEDGGGVSEAHKKSKIRRKIDKSRNARTMEISGPFHLQCSKSMGRLDGLKQVCGGRWMVGRRSG